MKATHPSPGLFSNSCTRRVRAYTQSVVRTIMGTMWQTGENQAKMQTDLTLFLDRYMVASFLGAWFENRLGCFEIIAHYQRTVIVKRDASALSRECGI